MRKFKLVVALALLAPQTCLDAQQIAPGEGARVVWDAVVECAGEARDTTKTFEEIKFYLRAPKAGIEGEWVPPDTIYITKGFERDVFTVAHEMMHHAIDGPRTGVKHPVVPFVTCGLFERPVVHPTGTFNYTESK